MADRGAEGLEVKNYDAKLYKLYIQQGGQCAISGKGCTRTITELHHCLHKAKWREKKYPLFIDSTLNLIGVCGICHQNQPHFGKIRDGQAEEYEAALREDHDLSRRVNCEN